MSDDDALTAELRRGNESALEEVYRRHAAHVFRVVVPVVGDPAQARDVVREVFVALWERPQELEPRHGPLRARLAVGARRCALIRVGPAGAVPDEELEAVELACLGGLSCRDIAEALGVSERVVKDRIRRGLERLGGTRHGEGPG